MTDNTRRKYFAHSSRYRLIRNTGEPSTVLSCIYRLSLGILVTCAIMLSNANSDDTPTVLQLWESSPHANSDSESFRHWDDEGEIPAACASCHSMTGFLDFIGADGSEVGSVDKNHLTDTVIACDTCHNDAIAHLPSVTFPSGAKITEAGTSTLCMSCHQGRHSTASVNANLNTLPADTPSASINFLNIHYRAAAATLLGTETQGGYEYAGKNYTGRFNHPSPFNTCTGCHDPHALTVKAETCSACHTGTSERDLSTIRTSTSDVDGDDDTSESIASELSTMHQLLGQMISLYGEEVIQKPIAYNAKNYPYFFHDVNSDGTADSDEAKYPNRYQSWTPRLLRAAYNYQFFAKDPGAWAHNPRYAAQLILDSIEDISSQLDVQLPTYVRP